jgi:hypothetical protein
MAQVIRTDDHYSSMGIDLRGISIGKHVIPLWLVAVILISGIGGTLGYYVWRTLTIQVEVKEPIEILQYPSSLSLYPGETKEFNVTVMNSASVNYTVLLIYILDNSSYQEEFVTFKDDTFNVMSGQQNLTTWLAVAPEAPAVNSTLTVELRRVGAGLLSFFDNFNTGNLENWTVRQGTWSAFNGQYYTSTGLVENGISTANLENLTNYTVQTDIAFKDTGTGFRAGIIFRYVDYQNYYTFELSHEYSCAVIGKYDPSAPDYGTNLAWLIQGSYPIQTNTDYLIKVVVQNNNFTCFINGQQVLSITDSSYLSGKVGLRARNADVLFDNFRVTPLS